MSPQTDTFFCSTLIEKYGIECFRFAEKESLRLYLKQLEYSFSEVALLLSLMLPETSDYILTCVGKRKADEIKCLMDDHETGGQDERASQILENELKSISQGKTHLQFIHSEDVSYYLELNGSTENITQTSERVNNHEDLVADSTSISIIEKIKHWFGGSDETEDIDDLLNQDESNNVLENQVGFNLYTSDFQEIIEFCLLLAKKQSHQTSQNDDAKMLATDQYSREMLSLIDSGDLETSMINKVSRQTSSVIVASVTTNFAVIKDYLALLEKYLTSDKAMSVEEVATELCSKLKVKIAIPQIIRQVGQQQRVVIYPDSSIDDILVILLSCHQNIIEMGFLSLESVIDAGDIKIPPLQQVLDLYMNDLGQGFIESFVTRQFDQYMVYLETKMQVFEMALVLISQNQRPELIENILIAYFFPDYDWTL
ncbi:MAG: hypothetical protein HN826_06785 [Methylococcales bacterium]|nr:hypothetical protein [Methylococcales bacterium]